MDNNLSLKNKKILIISLISFFIVFLDQLTKYLILKNFNINETVPIINNVFHLTLIKNTGAGFGILKNFNFLLIMISIAVIGIIFYYFKKIKENQLLLQVLAAFILGGALGNLIDRARLGYVVDFLDFRIWPVFNIADSFVTVGIIGLIVYLWKKG